MAPTVVTFALSPSYGFSTARDAHGWFVRVMREHEEFEVETDRARSLSFWRETVRQVVVGSCGSLASKLSPTVTSALPISSRPQLKDRLWLSPPCR
jgi:hypothetical protein